jgi:VanZ family protein
MPGSSMPGLLFFDIVGFDKIVHFFSFAFMALLMMIGLSKQYSDGCFYFNIFYLTVLSLSGYGILLEFIQGYVPQRTFEWWDAVANVAGVLFGRFMFYIIYQTRVV